MVSVIICTYNGEKYLQQCIDSVINQSVGLKELEIIVVDDVSTDSTVEILKEYESRYPENICLVVRDVNSGEAKEDNRKVALAYASGEYILWLDQDDWYEPNAVEILTKLMCEHPDLDYIEYGIRYVDEKGNQTGMSCRNDGPFSMYMIENEERRKDYARSGVLPGKTFVWSKIYKKEFLEENHICSNEGEMWTGFSDNLFSGLAVMYCKKIGKLDRLLINYRNYVGSWSHDSVINSRRQFERCKAGIAFYDECERRGILDAQKDMTEYIFVRTFLLKTFWKFLLKYNPIPIDILQFCQKEMYKRCPRMEANPIMKDRVDMMLLSMAMETKWTPEFLLALREEMISQINEKKINPAYLFL